MTVSLMPQEVEHLAYLAELCGLSVEDYAADLIRRHLPWVVLHVPSSKVQAAQVTAGERLGSLTIYED
jgi:hypothetical protein